MEEPLRTTSSLGSLALGIIGVILSRAGVSMFLETAYASDLRKNSGDAAVRVFDHPGGRAGWLVRLLGPPPPGFSIAAE